MLTVTQGRASVEDLSSRNGLLVNGKKIDGPTPLRDGDSITVGGQLMTIHGVETPDVVRARRSEMQTMQTATWLEAPTDDGADDTRISPTPLRSAPDARVNELTLVGAVAEKALAMGRPEDAHRLLERPLRDLLTRAPHSIDTSLAQRAAWLATRLASALNRGDWIDYVFDLYTARKELLPQNVVDELYTVLRRVRVGGSSLVNYLEALRNASSTFGPNDRFLISRIEGLEPLVGLK